ncbi:MAG: hypothetical protein IJM37_02575 [Lachnospiraceae bacterium]|nr:hypothetical protein [Lachnospiraceae bacterium]
MRTFKEKVVLVKDEAFCNCCGRKIVNEDFLEVEKEWGYFSSKDGEKISFDLCEKCFDKITADFKIKPQTGTVTEL